MSSPASTGTPPRLSAIALQEKLKRVGSTTLNTSFSRNMSDPFFDGDTMSGSVGPLSNSKRANGGVPTPSPSTDALIKDKNKESSKRIEKRKVGLDQGNSDARALTDALLARLMDQQETQEKQRQALKSTSDVNLKNRFLSTAAPVNSLPVTPNTESFPVPGKPAGPTGADASMGVSDENRDPASSDEISRLKAELAKAQNKIHRLDNELQQRGPSTDPVPVPAPFAPRANLPDPAPTGGGLSRPTGPSYRVGEWNGYDNAVDVNDLGMNGDMEIIRPRSRGPWNNSKTPWQPGPMTSDRHLSTTWYPNGGSRAFSHGYMDPQGPYQFMDGPHGDRLAPEQDMMLRPIGSRRGPRFDGRYNSPSSFGGNSYGGYNLPPGRMDPMGDAVGHAQMSQYPTYGQQPGGTALSPHATEFQSNMAWKSEVSDPRGSGLGLRSRSRLTMNHGMRQPVATDQGPTFLPTTEPLNYRRLLDRNVNCDWKYIVDKIVCSNDQQASIFLQQKLKVGTPEQKYDIVESIIAQAYPLMINRFGNFLVQRCFEHGTPEQVVKIAEAIRGNTLNLSMDPFGCHVVQKAFDSVPEDYKAIMVGELLRRIPETVIHRYACHVWQKLFELRWSETPPQIMTFVNEALRGMWHEVALGETGSLVVQNIFENCLEDDKRPCIEEVLANIDIVAHGQFGNWCIQHICEHGAPADRSRAVDHVIRYAAEYSTDQFASKVVEKCLKVGGPEFLSRYLDRVCEGRHDRPRIPLIDISSDQYGNYLIQYILTHASAQHREVVAAHIRKHMVSLRGSKFGSRVGMLCTNPAVATRPGAGVGPGMPRMGGPSRRAW